jgi:hypothetical protein
MCCPLLLLALTNRQKWIDIAAIFLFGGFGYRILEGAFANVANVVLLPRSVQVGKQGHEPGQSFAFRDGGAPRTALTYREANVLRRTIAGCAAQTDSSTSRIFLLQSFLNRSI